MSQKFQAKLSALLTGLFGFVAWLATVPPEQQSGILGTLAQAFPLAWQPTIGLWSKLFATASGIWMTFKLSHHPQVQVSGNSPTFVELPLKSETTIKTESP